MRLTPIFAFYTCCWTYSCWIDTMTNPPAPADEAEPVFFSASRFFLPHITFFCPRNNHNEMETRPAATTYMKIISTIVAFKRTYNSALALELVRWSCNKDSRRCDFLAQQAGIAAGTAFCSALGSELPRRTPLDTVLLPSWRTAPPVPFGSQRNLKWNT